jgi:acetylxylan esterase
LRLRGESYNDVTGKPSSGTGQWSGPCSGGTVTKTAQQWGDLVRSYFPGYTGHRPRLQHWHGATDTTLNFKNVAEDIKEWTNLLGLSETPTATEQNTPKSGTTHQYWKNSCYTVYETFVLANTGHQVSLDGPTLAKYFGIDTAGGQDPETAACPGAVPGGGSGAGGAGGGGSTGAGGAAGTSGGADGGPGGAGGSTRADAAQPGSGGSVGTGGAAPGTGGVSGTGGNAATGGQPGTGGSSTHVDGSGGAAGHGGSSGSGGASTTPVGDKSGGGCHLGSQAMAANSAWAALAVMGLALLAVRRRSRRQRR